MRRKQKKIGIFGRIIQLFLWLVMIGVVGGAGFVGWAVLTSPPLDLKQVSPQRYRTTMLDADGNVMRYLAGEEANRVYVPLEEIPQDVRNAFIAIEDQRFYEHRGIDIRGIGRAFVEDLRTMSFSQGASTLTQQLIKNNLFAAGMEERTPVEKLKRKIQEQYLAIVLESLKDKDWILENYLNTIDLGGVWGVETAALKYFGQHVRDLSAGQAAVIAAITKNPSAYNPLHREEDNRTRRNLILKEMLRQGYLDEPSYEAAMAQDVYGLIRQVAERGEAVTPVYSWFEDAVLEAVRNDLEQVAHYAPDDCWNLIYSGGLTIETTQDSKIQQICEENLRILQSDAQFTAVVTEPATGAVRGIIGARGEKTVSRALNRATDAVRQPGSTLKLLGAYAEALERGTVTLASVYEDRPTKYRTDGTMVKNADGSYAGRMTVREAIAKSVNTVALQCFQEVGLEAVWERLQLFGLAHLDDADRVEALALGGTYHGVTNLELTAAYGAIANGGLYIEPYFYTRVLDQDGNVLLRKSPQSRRAVSATTAALLTSAMEDVLTSGTGRRAAFPGQSLAGKTGTTTEQRDLWFIGYSPYYACGVWSGYDDNRAQMTNEVQALWQEMMRGIHADLPSEMFALSGGMERQTICTKCGALALNGLCDRSVQGDMTRSELFVPGTEPKEFCDCHVRVSICPESGKRVTTGCPHPEERIFLRDAVPDTAEEAALVPTESCPVHAPLWTEPPVVPETPIPTPENPSEETPPTSTGLPPWVEELWDGFRRQMGLGE